MAAARATSAHLRDPPAARRRPRQAFALRTTASTSPHGSTSIEWPQVRRPPDACRPARRRARSTGSRSRAPAAALPMRLARSCREGRRDDDQRAGLPQRPVELGKAQVVADRQPDAPARRASNGDRRAAGAIVRRLVVILVARRRSGTGGSCRSARRARRRGRVDEAASATRAGSSHAIGTLPPMSTRGAPAPSARGMPAAARRRRARCDRELVARAAAPIRPKFSGSSDELAPAAGRMPIRFGCGTQVLVDARAPTSSARRQRASVQRLAVGHRFVSRKSHSANRRARLRGRRGGCVVRTTTGSSQLPVTAILVAE